MTLFFGFIVNITIFLIFFSAQDFHQYSNGKRYVTYFITFINYWHYFFTYKSKKKKNVILVKNLLAIKFNIITNKKNVKLAITVF